MEGQTTEGAWGERPLKEERVLYCVDQVRYLPGLHERYWGRLDEVRRAAVGMRTERRVKEALGAGKVRRLETKLNTRDG